MGEASLWAGTFGSGSLSWPRIRQIGYSIADQGLSVGGMFLANIALARTQTKEEYGIFALSYSVFTLLAGLHNAAILEAYTVYGSGRYHERFPAYTRLLWHSNLLVALATTLALTLAWLVLVWTAPALASRTLLGIALACGVLLTALFVRRTFYMRRRPDLAARFSLVFFLICAALLLLSMRTGILNGLLAFLIAALAWSVASLFVARELPVRAAGQSFTELEPAYWTEHWKYSRWVLVTALVFQLMTQGYYWLAAGFLSVREVGNLRAMYNLVTPVDQLFVAMSLLILPMMSFRYASRRLAGLLPLWKAYCIGGVLVTCGFEALVTIFAKPLVHSVYAGRFDDIAPLVGILALLPVVMAIGNSMNSALKAMERPQTVFYAYAASGAATFLAGVPLLIHFGLRGAVYGMLISAGAYTATLGIAFVVSLQADTHEVGLAVAAKEDFLR